MSAEVGMKRAAVLIAVVALAAVASRAQNAAESQVKCTLAGTVVDAISQQPVREAVVSARGFLTSGGAASTSSLRSLIAQAGFHLTSCRRDDTLFLPPTKGKKPRARHAWPPPFSVRPCLRSASRRRGHLFDARRDCLWTDLQRRWQACVRCNHACAQALPPVREARV